MNIRKSKTTTLITAMRILSRDIETGDGIANMAINEAADRLQEMSEALGVGIRFAEEILRLHDAVGGDKKTSELIRTKIEEMANLTT